MLSNNFVSRLFFFAASFSVRTGARPRSLISWLIKRYYMRFNTSVLLVRMEKLRCIFVVCAGRCRGWSGRNYISLCCFTGFSFLIFHWAHGAMNGLRNVPEERINTVYISIFLFFLMMMMMMIIITCFYFHSVNEFSSNFYFFFFFSFSRFPSWKGVNRRSEDTSICELN